MQKSTVRVHQRSVVSVLLTQGKLMWWFICKNVPRGVKSSLGDLLTLFQKWWGNELFPNKNDTVWREMRGHWKRINMIFYKGNCRDKDCRKWWGLRFHQSTEFTQSSSSALNSQCIQSVEEHQTLFAMGAQVVCLLIKVSYCARMCKWVHPSVFFLQAVWGCLYLLKSDTQTQSN